MICPYPRKRIHAKRSSVGLSSEQRLRKLLPLKLSFGQRLIQKGLANRGPERLLRNFDSSKDLEQSTSGIPPKEIWSFFFLVGGLRIIRRKAGKFFLI